MGSFAIIPAAPVLLDDIDRSESARMGELRALINDTLTSQAMWALPVASLPPVAGLGGWGIDRGIDTRTSQLLTGDEWVSTVERLTEEERELAEAADPAIIVATLHAHAAGVDIGALGTSENLLLPIDLSAAATENAPLAPIDGAMGFDAEVVDALKPRIAADAAGADGTVDAPVSGLTVDSSRLLGLNERAGDMAANLSALAAGIDYVTGKGARLSAPDFVFDERVHEVRSLCGTGTWE